MKSTERNGGSADAMMWNAFRQGSKSAFESLYRSHYVALYHYGNRLCADTELVRDAIQALFVDLWRRREYLGATNHVRPYLYQAMRRLVIKNLEKQRKSPLYVVATLQQPSTEEVLISLEKNDDQKEKLERALLALTDKQQEVVRLRFFENLDNQAIANRMGVQVNTVYNLISLALSNLRIQLKNYPDLLF